MILLIPNEWFEPGPILSQSLGSVLNALLMSVYDEPLNPEYSWRMLDRPEDFPFKGQLIEFISPNPFHNAMVAAFHNEDDGMVVTAMNALGFEKVRGAKLLLRNGVPDEEPVPWYCAVRINGLETAAKTLTKIYESTKSECKIVH